MRHGGWRGKTVVAIKRNGVAEMIRLYVPDFTRANFLSIRVTTITMKTRKEEEKTKKKRKGVGAAPHRLFFSLLHCRKKAQK